MDETQTCDVLAPPHSLEAEQAVLGGLMLDPAALDVVADLLTEEDFYRFDHRLIYRHINRLIIDGRPADVVTVAEALENCNRLQTAGGIPYLADLARNTPSIANIRHYARIVRERRVRRDLLEAGKLIMESALEPGGRGASQLLDEAEANIFRISQAQIAAHGGFVDMPPVMSEVIRHIEQAAEAKDGITGIPSGFADLDRHTLGLQPGDFILVAGRPSMGKTAFGLNIAEHVALAQKKAVAIFSMEMPPVQLGMRMLASVSGINFSALRAGQLNDEEWETVARDFPLLANAPIHIEPAATHTPQQLRTLARRKYRECGGLGLILVDYLQLLSGDSHRTAENRNNEIGTISRALKQLAKELNVPLLALTQLNRALESRPNKRPVMSDLRDSGSLEQDADMILFLYRDEAYHPDSPARGIAEVIIGKQRNGPIGTVELMFSGQRQRFRDLAHS